MVRAPSPITKQLRDLSTFMMFSQRDTLAPGFSRGREHAGSQRTPRDRSRPPSVDSESFVVAPAGARPIELTSPTKELDFSLNTWRSPLGEPSPTWSGHCP